MFLEIQLGAAFADGDLHDAERNVLLQICDTLGFSRVDFERLVTMIRAELHSHQRGASQGMSIEDAYAILNIDASATDVEVKKAYRVLTSQHHPDKLAAKGLPREMMELAEEKTHEIRSAYELIREARGFK
jgi:DnaJ like chaperone protein